MCRGVRWWKRNEVKRKRRKIGKRKRETCIYTVAIVEGRKIVEIEEK